MPTTFNWIYLGIPVNGSGTTLYLDENEVNTAAESAVNLVGQTFGTAGNPLYNNIVSAQMNGAANYNNTSVLAQTYTTTYGGTSGTLTHDGTATYNITITYADGTTATSTAVLAQAVTGQLFFAPALTATAAHTAKPILSLRIDSVTSNNASFAIDRPIVGWDNGWIDGTSGNDNIDDGVGGPLYIEPIGGGSDVVDGGDGISSAGTAWQDDRIRAYGGNDTVWSGLGNDLVYGGDAGDRIFGTRVE